MGVLGNNALVGASAAGSAGSGNFYSHEIANSVRFNASASSHMYRTQGTPTNVDKCTISFWVKRGKLGATMYGMTGSGTSGSYSHITFGGDGSDADKFYWLQNPGSPTIVLESNPLFRDPSAWYNIILANDSTQSTDSDRNKIYINGVQLTDWGTGFTPSFYSTLNSDFLMNTSGHKIFVGSGGDSAGGAYLPFDGYIAEYVFIDGTQYASTDFGEMSNGVWIAKDPSGLTFGNNGCYLKMAAGAIGTDSSGNGNNFTVSNIEPHDVVLDSPTFNSDSNGGNFATWNPLNAGSYTTLAEGNLKATGTGSGASNPSGTFAMTSGKWYWEMLVVDEVASYPYPGLTVLGNITNSPTTGGDIWAMRYDIGSGSLGGNSGANITGLGTLTTTSTGVTTATDGDIISWYLDCDNRKAWIAKNGTIPNSGNPATGANPQWSWTATPNNPITFTAQVYNGDDTILNAGQDGTFAGEKTAQGNSDDTGYGNFYYAPSTGFLAMCSGNLPISAQIDPAQNSDDYPQKLFQALAYTGDGNTTRSLTLNFKPDWTWLKQRSHTYQHTLYDTTRTYATLKALGSDGNWAEGGGGDNSGNGYLSSSDSSGFSLNRGTNTSAGTSLTNSISTTYISWNWRANAGTTSAGSGDLTSTHQVDPSGGFSIVKAVGDGGSGDKTVSHGLSAAPTVILAKDLDATRNWDTYFSEGVTAGSGMRLNTTDNPLTGRWGTINSSIFTCKDSYTWGGTDNYIYYCFTNIEGYIKSGSYIGNGDGSNGAFIYTGFRPAFILVKRTSGTKAWLIEDNTRDLYNPTYHVLKPNNSNAEEAFTDGTDYNDFLSNGFKVARGGDAANWNVNGETYVYLAMAHNPFKYSLAR